MSTVVRGRIEAGKRLGRQLGFPTANLRPDGDEAALPRNGVYAAAFWVEEEDGARMCMLNQGTHPTAPEGKPTIEAHLLDYHGDLYGRRARVEYLHFLRPERRFESLAALSEQLSKDRVDTRAWIEAARNGTCGDEGAGRVREIHWHR